MSPNTRYQGPLSVLEERHVISILVFLQRNGQSKRIDLYNAVSTNPNMPKKIDRLESLGLVKQRREHCTHTTYVSLTPTGEEVVGLLRRMEDAMENPHDRRRCQQSK
jgi:DNA-binding HxlR family transcriptional regulator